MFPAAKYFSKLFLFFSLVPGIFSAQSVIGFKHYGVGDGLSQGSIMALAQDKQGFIWVGTENGLDRFDGYSFREYQNNPHDTNSLSNNIVFSLVVDSAGKVWIGAGKEINIYNPTTDKLSRYKKWNPPAKKAKHFISKMTFLDGGLLFVTTELGFATLDTASGKYVGYLGMKEGSPDSTGKAVTAFFHDKENNMWLGTEGGELLKWKIGTDEIVNEATVVCVGDQNEGGFISGIEALGDDKLFLTTGCGVRFFKKGTKSFINYFQENSFSDTLCHCDFAGVIKQDEDHFVVLGQERLFVMDFAKKEITTLVQTLTETDKTGFGTAREFIQDKQGMIWIGDYGQGIFAFNPYATQFGIITAEETNPNHVKNPYVFNFCEAGDSVFIGSNWGIDYLKPKTGIVKSLNPFPEKPFNHFPLAIEGMVMNDSNNLWFISRWSVKGLVHWNLSNGKIKIYDKTNGFESQRMSDIIKQPDGNFWISSRDMGVVIMDPRTEKITSLHYDSTNTNSISSNAVHQIYPDKNGILWISTNKGLNRYDTRTKIFTRYRLDVKDATSISCDNVWGVVQDINGNIWVGTDFGFGKLDESTGKFKNYSSKDGLPDNCVNAMLADSSGFLWISTNKGICCFDPKKETFTLYGKEDGLQEMEFNVGSALYGKSGLMYFGGVNGMNYFNPKEVKKNNYEPPVYITSIFVNGNSLSLDSNIALKKAITLDYTQNFLAFDFVALNYYRSSKNRFMCMMEGVDKDWVNLGNNRKASYPNLSPGEYVFRVKACNNDGVWNETGTSIHITIQPPFWKTKWFYTLCFLLVIGGFWFYVNLREKNLKRDRKILEVKVEERTNDLRLEKERVSAAHKDISDSIQYARRIQEAILPLQDEWNKALPDSFILYKPRDVVSGDFYWLYQKGEKIFVAVADCTGHGVPGAFMSMISHTILNEIVLQEKLDDPAKILSRLHSGIRTSLKQDGGTDTRDGLDIALICIDKQTNTLQFAGANRPLVIISKNALTEIKPDKKAIGGIDEEGEKKFTRHEINLNFGDQIYLFTDGFPDQFGGPKGKKFGYKQLREMLAANQMLNMHEQKEIVEKSLTNWKGQLEQVDDILLIGIKI